MNGHLIIVGGGVIGLSCAVECRRRGYRVTLLEEGVCGGQASIAAAGMLAPYSENTEQPDDFFKLCLESLQLYFQWAKDIERLSGQSIELNQSGSLNVFLHEADLLGVETRMKWQSRYGARMELLSAGDIKTLEPELDDSVLCGVHYPEEAHVYAPAYVKALIAACRKLGVEIVEHTSVVGITFGSSSVQARTADGAVLTADRLIFCTGAYAGLWEDAFSLRIPVYPIRGQICAFQRSPQTQLKHMVFSSQGYFVSKANGALICGASEDVAGFETSVTENGISRLVRWTQAMLPSLACKSADHSWAGLRPATQDGYPLIGPLTSVPQVIFAVGHYRNGILLSPVTAKIVADLVQDRGSAEMELPAFAPERFAM